LREGCAARAQQKKRRPGCGHAAPRDALPSRLCLCCALLLPQRARRPNSSHRTFTARPRHARRPPATAQDCTLDVVVAPVTVGDLSRSSRATGSGPAPTVTGVTVTGRGVDISAGASSHATLGAVCTGTVVVAGSTTMADVAQGRARGAPGKLPCARHAARTCRRRDVSYIGSHTPTTSEPFPPHSPAPLPSPPLRHFVPRPSLRARAPPPRADRAPGAFPPSRFLPDRSAPSVSVVSESLVPPASAPPPPVPTPSSSSPPSLLSSPTRWRANGCPSR